MRDTTFFPGLAGRVDALERRRAATARLASTAFDIPGAPRPCILPGRRMLRAAAPEARTATVRRVEDVIGGREPLHPASPGSARA